MKVKKKIDLIIPNVQNKKSKKQLDISNSKISELNIKDIIPNVIDNVLVTMINERHQIVLPFDMNGEKYKNWLKHKGGIFSKDIHALSLNKNVSKYFLYENENEKMILRLINEEELLDFEVRHLVHGYIKDVPYMLLKQVENNELTSHKINNSLSLEEEIQEIAVDKIDEKISDVDEVVYLNSISLFED